MSKMNLKPTATSIRKNNRKQRLKASFLPISILLPDTTTSFNNDLPNEALPIDSKMM